MLGRKLEVVELTEERRHREESMFKCISICVIIVSLTEWNKFIGNQWQIFEEEVDAHLM